MLTTNISIGKVVALANLDPGFFAQQSLERDVADLVDLLRARIEYRPINEVAESVLESLFDLRFNLVKWLAIHDKDLELYSETFAQHIAVNIQLAPYSDLAKATARVLSKVMGIVSPIMESSGEEILTHYGDPNLEKPTYGALASLSMIPAPRVRHLKDWVDASLKLEVGIILADLILTRQAQLSEQRIESELISFLDQTLIQFGAYSIFTGSWVPDQGDDSSSTNGMRLLAAKLELESGLGEMFSKEELSELLNS